MDEGEDEGILGTYPRVLQGGGFPNLDGRLPQKIGYFG